MNILLRVLWREYRTRVRSPIFLIVTAIGLLLIVGGSIFMKQMGESGRERPVKVTVVDQTGWALAPLKAALAAQPNGPDGKPLAPVELTEAQASELAALQTQVKERDLDVLLVMTGQDPASFAATIASGSLGDMGRANERIAPVLEGVVRAARIQASGADPKVIQAVTAPVQIKTEFQTATGSEDLGARIGVASFFMAALYGTTLTFCAFVLQGVLEEKTSRVAEVLIATVKPFVLMAGKVIGVGLVGLTQLLIWAGGYTLADKIGLPVMELGSVGVPDGIWGWLVLYFITGYFLYASLFAAVGASINRMEESQAAMTPLMIPIIIAYFLSFMAIQDPAGTVARISSLVPFTAPTVMLSRILLGDPAPWEIGLSIALLILTGIGTTWLSAKIYRAGILRYDGRLSLKAAFQSLRHRA
jgi:ABC-2 type transport system permease protein